MMYHLNCLSKTHFLAKKIVSLIPLDPLEAILTPQNAQKVSHLEGWGHRDKDRDFVNYLIVGVTDNCTEYNEITFLYSEQ